MTVLKTKPKNKELDPMTKHKKFSRALRGMVLTDYPPNSAREIWMKNVAIRITMKRGLLKKFLKTLI